MGRVAGKVAIVTGAASGLGQASAKRLAEEGARLIVADIDEHAGRATADNIDGAEYTLLDVSKEKAWEALMDQVLDRYGKLDVLVNNAGVVRLATIEDTTEEIWRFVNSVGTDGTFYGCKHALRVMKPAGSGSIINMCSSASVQAGPNIFAYAASKSAIRGMTKSIAVLSSRNGHGVRCNSAHPGNMRTPMLERVYAEHLANNPDAATADNKIWVGEPEDVANMVLFLASDESKSVNGAAMLVDNTTTITEGVVPAHS